MASFKWPIASYLYREVPSCVAANIPKKWRQNEQAINNTSNFNQLEGRESLRAEAVSDVFSILF